MNTLQISFRNRFPVVFLVMVLAAAMAGLAEDHNVPILAFDGVPLRATVNVLAKQAGVVVTFDPSLTTASDPPVTLRWQQVTALQALRALAENYNWQLRPGASSNSFRIVARAAGKSIPQPNVVDLSRKEPGDETAPAIDLEKVPVFEGLKALASQIRMNLMLAPDLANLGTRLVTRRWTNATPRQAMKDIIDSNHLQLTRVANAPVYRIEKRPGP